MSKTVALVMMIHEDITKALTNSKNWTFGLDLDFFGKWFEFWTFLEMVQKCSEFGAFLENYPKILQILDSSANIV